MTQTRRRNPQRAQRRREPLSPRKRRLFTALSLFTPLLLLALAELVCRALGFGGYPPILDRVGDDGGTTWYATSRSGTNTFFTNDALTGGMRIVHFTTPKPPNTVRIVLVGGSAMQGYPQPLPLTNGSFLAAMLRDVWDDGRNVQVLNFGATAVASFPVLCTVDEALDHEPDLLVVMSGNNEFYGAYGVASLPPGARSALGMRVVRTVRSWGLTQGIAAPLGRFHGGDDRPEGKLMEIMATGAAIGPDDSKRNAAAHSLKASLTDIVRRCDARGVPVIVCTLPTNERDLAPIGVSDDTSDAAAAAHFRRAEEFTARGDFGHARDEYILARDFDPMPWRATTRARDAVLTAAASGGAILCDLEAAFRAASADSAIGQELLDDHVHFSVRGQAWFARTLLGAFTQLPAPLTVDPEKITQLPDDDFYAERLGRSVYTDYVAASRIRSLFDIPFMSRNNEPARRRSQDRSDSLLAAMTDDDRRVVAQWRDPQVHGATDRPLSMMIAIDRMRRGDYASAEPLLLTARAAVPDVSLWRLQITWFLLTCRRHTRDAPTVDDQALCFEAVRIGELLSRFGHDDSPQVNRFLGLAYNLSGNHAAAVTSLEIAVPGATGADGWEVVRTLVDSYARLGRTADARAVLERAARDPQMAEAARGLLGER